MKYTMTQQEYMEVRTVDDLLHKLSKEQLAALSDHQVVKEILAITSSPSACEAYAAPVFSFILILFVVLATYMSIRWIHGSK